MVQLTRPTQQWALDFVHDRVGEGRALGVLTIIDEFTHECLATEVDPGISSRRVALTLERFLETRPRPLSLGCAWPCARPCLQCGSAIAATWSGNG